VKPDNIQIAARRAVPERPCCRQRETSANWTTEDRQIATSKERRKRPNSSSAINGWRASVSLRKSISRAAVGGGVVVGPTRWRRRPDSSWGALVAFWPMDHTRAPAFLLPVGNSKLSNFIINKPDTQTDTHTCKRVCVPAASATASSQDLLLPHIDSSSASRGRSRRIATARSRATILHTRRPGYHACHSAEARRHPFGWPAPPNVMAVSDSRGGGAQKGAAISWRRTSDRAAKRERHLAPG
jgi:hypothetical protein